MTERDLRGYLKRKLPNSTHFVPVENTSGPGTPDLNACLNGVEVWIELKIIIGVHKKKFQKAFTYAQHNWLLSRSRAGGRTFLMARQVLDKEILIWSGESLAGCLADEVLEKLKPDYRLPLRRADDLQMILF